MVDQNVPGSNPAFDAIYNPSGYDGQVTSDFMRLGGIPPHLRKDLIDFSTADFDEFKNRFKDYVKSVYPQDFTNFVESDLGIMLSELFAYMAAVLSFKADALAQESYIATAKTQDGVTKLLELIGVNLRGPVSAKATTTLEITDVDKYLSEGESCVIDEANRVIQSTSTRDNLPLTFTLYKVNTNGNIDMESPSVSLPYEDSVNFDGSSWSGLVLLEGAYQTIEGTFPAGVSRPSIEVVFPSVIEGSLTVSGANASPWWSEIDNIWFASADSQVFQLTYNDDFSCKLVFGDGTVGKAPTPGTDWKVFYRTGGGDRGNVPQGHLNKSGAGYEQASQDSIPFNMVNKNAATGGVVGQTIDEARRMGPLWFAAQYRAVTGQDYTTFANIFRSSVGKTGKGLAVLRDNGSAGNMIDIYVLQKATENHLERASFEFKKELLEYLEKYRMLTDEITIVDGIVRTLDVVGTLYIDRQQKLSSEDIKQRAVSNIQEFFDTNIFDFGQAAIFSEVTNYVLKDAGVRFFSIDNYSSDIYVDFNEIIQLNNIELNVQYV